MDKRVWSLRGVSKEWPISHYNTHSTQKTQFDTKIHGSTEKCPVWQKKALPSMHQLSLPLSKTASPLPLRNIFFQFYSNILFLRTHRKLYMKNEIILIFKYIWYLLGTLTKPNVGEHTQDTTREFQWRQTNSACAFYCVKGQYIVFQPTTTAICRTCTVVIKKYGLPLVAFTNTKSWHDPPLEILPVAPGHQQPPNIGLLSRDCWWTVATLEAPGILNKLFQH